MTGKREKELNNHEATTEKGEPTWQEREGTSPPIPGSLGYIYSLNKAELYEV